MLRITTNLRPPAAAAASGAPTAAPGAPAAEPALRLLPAKTVARMLNVDETTLGRWNRRGEGPPSLKIGRFRKYLESDLREWVKERRRVGPLRLRGIEEATAGSYPKIVERILEHVSRAFDVPVATMLSRRRERPVVRARWAAQYLIVECSGFCKNDASRVFRVDHTSVIYACAQVTAMLAGTSRQPDEKAFVAALGRARAALEKEPA